MGARKYTDEEINNLRVGDKLLCVESGCNYITRGKIYTLTEDLNSGCELVFIDNEGDGITVWVEDGIVTSDNSRFNILKLNSERVLNKKERTTLAKKFRSVVKEYQELTEEVEKHGFETTDFPVIEKDAKLRFYVPPEEY